jgi:hypothetical protein
MNMKGIVQRKARKNPTIVCVVMYWLCSESVSNPRNDHNPLTSGIPFGIFHHPGKMHLKQIEMNCPSKYSCTPPQMIPRMARRMTTKYDPQIPNVTRDSTGYPTWYRLAARPLRQIMTAERIFAKKTIKRASLISAPRAIIEEPTLHLDTFQDSLHLLFVRKFIKC